MKVSIGSIVFRAADLDASLAFYQALGLEFVQERHGTGPTHYSCEMGATVIEIYPGKPGVALDRKIAGSVTVGFQVAHIDAVVDVLQARGFAILSAPKDGDWGWRAVVQDPDGRAIELSQTKADLI